MPKIKRWFPVSHEINSDHEVWELTDRFGDRALRVWLEILSIADRNEGVVPPLSDAFARAVAFKCHTSATRVRQVYDYARTAMWLECDSTPRVRNYAKYHMTREMIKSRVGIGRVPSEPSEPSEPLKSPAGAGAPVDNSVDNFPAPEPHPEPKKSMEAMLKLAVEIGGKDTGSQQKLCQWVVSMAEYMKRKRDPPERTIAVIELSLKALQARVEQGYAIKSLWGLLNKIFDGERTKYIQGPENEANKKGPIPIGVREIMKGIGNG